MESSSNSNSKISCSCHSSSQWGCSRSRFVSGPGLQNQRITFLICGKSDLSVIAGVELQVAASDFLTEVFDNTNTPLVLLPHSVTNAELRLKLAQIPAHSQRTCPKCGQLMQQRKAAKGKNAGRQFWVCSAFPGCRSVLKI